MLALEDDGSDARARIDAEIARALAEDRAEAIVLGCAGMAKLARDLSAKHGCPVIDGVGAAVKLAEMLVALGLKTSKRGGYEAGAVQGARRCYPGSDLRPACREFSPVIPEAEGEARSYPGPRTTRFDSPREVPDRSVARLRPASLRPG